MSILPALALLIMAAILEAGGDALVRKGLITPRGVSRGMFFFAGAAALFAYGITVNLPRWDFGRLLGVYVAVFFVAAQVISYLAFNQPPKTPVLVGGVLIIGGGLIMTFWRGVSG